MVLDRVPESPNNITSASHIQTLSPPKVGVGKSDQEKPIAAINSKILSKALLALHTLGVERDVITQS